MGNKRGRSPSYTLDLGGLNKFIKNEESFENNLTLVIIHDIIEIAKKGRGIKMRHLYEALDGTIGDYEEIECIERNILNPYIGKTIKELAQGIDVERLYIHNLAPFYYVSTGKPASVQCGHHLNTLSTYKTEWYGHKVEDLILKKVGGVNQSTTGCLEKKYMPEVSVYVRFEESMEYSFLFASLVARIYNEKGMTLRKAYEMVESILLK